MTNRPTNPRRAGRRTTLCGVAALLALSAQGIARQQSPVAAPPAAARVEAARSSLDRWVETKQVLSRESRDWALGKELLADRIALLEKEIATLRAREAEARGSIADADRKREELLAQTGRLKTFAEFAEGIVARLEGRTRELLKRLPDRLRERVKPLSQRLPDPEAKVGVDAKPRSLSERFQNVVGILNEVNKFNREITVESEVRTLPDGSAVQVTTLYVGIAQAYYAGANGTVAGVGFATRDGWNWQSANASAGEIERAIGMLEKGQVADYVKLPIRID